MQHPRIAAAPSEEFANLLADDATDNYWDATEGNAKRPLLQAGRDGEDAPRRNLGR